MAIMPSNMELQYSLWLYFLYQASILVVKVSLASENYNSCSTFDSDGWIENLSNEYLVWAEVNNGMLKEVKSGLDG
ncbi:hypothetical protein Sjap_003739 [Stephania japonica]|uniref:Uncharacterized protein n=1 Tax=Stephania japonica TaxID=461633 RepID=A0AAP0KR46_9MAGN